MDFEFRKRISPTLTANAVSPAKTPGGWSGILPPYVTLKNLHGRGVFLRGYIRSALQVAILRCSTASHCIKRSEVPGQGCGDEGSLRRAFCFLGCRGYICLPQMNTEHAWKKEQQYAPLLDERQRSALMLEGIMMQVGFLRIAPQQRVHGFNKMLRMKRMYIDVFLN